MEKICREYLLTPHQGFGQWLLEATHFLMYVQYSLHAEATAIASVNSCPRSPIGFISEVVCAQDRNWIMEGKVLDHGAISIYIVQWSVTQTSPTP